MNNTQRTHIIPFFLLASVLIVLALAPQSHAEQRVERKTIVVFIPDTDWPPYVVSNAQDGKRGVLVDILASAAAPLGYTVETRQLPNKRGWLQLERGEVDVHPKAIEWTPEPHKFIWSDPFMDSEDVFLYRADSQIKYESPDSMTGKTIVAMTDFIYPELEKEFASGRIKRVNVGDPFAMLDMVRIGRVDAAIVNRKETEWLFKTRPNLSPELFRIDDKAIGSAAYRYAFTQAKDWAPFIEELNKTLKKMKKNGRLKAIIQQYR